MLSNLSDFLQVRKHPTLDSKTMAGNILTLQNSKGEGWNPLPKPE